MKKEELLSVFYGKEKWEIWNKFKNIESSIEETDELYEFWDDIRDMLLSEKSHIKMRGFRLICKLAKWDKYNGVDELIDILLQVLDDEKPTIVRQCLSSMNNLLLYKPELANKVEAKLKSVELSKYNDSMSPLIKKDIDNILENL